MAYTGRKVGGKEAKRIGLVNDCLPSLEEMYRHVQAIATNIASKSPLVIKGIKNSIQYARDHSVQDSLNYIAAWNTGLIFSDDLMEAFGASVEKREAKFKDL